MKSFSAIVGLFLLLAAAQAADNQPSDPDRKIRDRYESILARNPFQKRAFDRVYESYSLHEGLDHWITQLRDGNTAARATDTINLLLGQIYDRRFKPDEAALALEQVRGAKDFNYQILLGTIHYKLGKNESAIDLLNTALDSVEQPEERARVSRLLGNLYLRTGKKDAAIRSWSRIVEQTPNDVFAQLELAVIYEENLMWAKAIEVYETIIKLSPSDPYRRCRSLRSIGAARLAMKEHPEAIAAFEKALSLVSPGNWLFEDLKSRLIGVYEDIGDLPGFVRYLQAKLESEPNDLEFRDLLADTLMRQKKHQAAEKEYRFILKRNPRHVPTWEKLLALHQKRENREQVIETFEQLVSLNPRDPDYIRRLGSFHLKHKNQDEASRTWRRIVAGNPGPEHWAELGAWFESAELLNEAAEAFGKALQLRSDKEWTLRLADLRHQLDQKDEAKELWLSLVTPETTPSESIELATVLENHSLPKEAATVLARTLESTPEHYDAHLALARNFMRRRLPKQALPHFEKLAGQRENEFLRRRGEDGRLEVFAQLDQLNEKRAEWEKQLADDPDSGEIMSRLAQLYSRSGQREEAVAMYERRLATNPDDNEFRRDLANAYLRLNKRAEAVAAFRELVERDPTRARGHLQQLVSLHLTTNDRTELFDAAQKIVSLAPADPRARLQLAQAYQTFSQPSLALEQFRHLVRLEPREPTYQKAYGEALAARRLFGEANTAFRKMYEAATTDEMKIEAVVLLAGVYLQLKQLDELLAEFRRSVGNTPRKHAAYLELAAIHEKAEQPEKAMDILESALNQVEDRQEALRSLIHLADKLKDIPKVRRYYEMLLAEQGQPTIAEFETLGRIYVQLGEFEQARDIWRKVNDLAGQDPVALFRLASVLKRLGFADQYLDVMGRVLDLQPYNYRKRYEYALTLAQARQPKAALDQLLKIIELGEPPRTNAIIKITRPQRVSSYRSSYGSYRVSVNNFLNRRGTSTSFRFNNSWIGTFSEFRRQLVVAMVSLARKSIGDEALIDIFQGKIDRDSEDVQSLRDLAIVYRVLGRQEDQFRTIKALLAVSDHEPRFAHEAAAYLHNKGKSGQAAELLSSLLSKGGPYEMSARAGVVALKLKAGLTNKVADHVAILIKKSPGNIYSIGSHLVNSKSQRSLGEKLLKDLVAEHSSYERSVNSMFERLNATPQTKAAAIAAQRSVLLGGTNKNYRLSTYAYPPISQVYTPKPPSQYYGSYSINGMTQLPSGITQQPDYQMINLFIAVRKHEQANPTNQLSAKPIAEAMRDQCVNFHTNGNKTVHNRLISATRLLLAHYTSEKQHDRAEQLLTNLIAKGETRLDWFNARIFLLERQTNYPAMYPVYDEMQQYHPAQSNQVIAAKAAVALLQDDVDRAAQLLQSAGNAALPTGTLTSVASKLAAKGKSDLALKLLNHNLKNSTRSTSLLRSLAFIHSQRQEHEQAIAYGKEAWERYLHDRYSRTSSSTYFSRSSSSSRSTSIPYDSYLQSLYRYHEAAQSENEFLKSLETRLAEQPDSVQLHVNLAQLYQRKDDNKNLTRILESLVKQRPDLLYAQIALADALGENGREQRAKALYEKTLKQHPNAYSAIQSKLRTLMRKLGRQQEMAKLDAHTASRISDRNALRSLASQYLADKNYEEAAKTFQRLLQHSPGDSFAIGRLAQSLAKAGRYEEAFATYTNQLSFSSHSTVYRTGLIREAAQLAHQIGKLDALQTVSHGRRMGKTDDFIAPRIDAFVALHRKDLDRAHELFSKMDLRATGHSLTEFLRIVTSLRQPARWLRLLEGANMFEGAHSTSISDAYLAAGEPEKALESLAEYQDFMFRQMSGHSHSQYNYYYILEKICELGLWEAAESYAATNRLVTTNPKSSSQTIDDLIAKYYVEQGRFTNLVSSVLAKNPWNQRDTELIDTILRRLNPSKNREQKNALLQILLKRQPKNNKHKTALARIHFNAHRFDEARKLLKEVTSKANAGVNQRWMLADTYRFAGETNQAIQVWADWLKKNPKNARFHTEHAVNLERAGRLAEARAAYQRAVDIAAKSKDQGSMDGWLAVFERKHGRPEAYIEYKQAEFKKKPDRSRFNRVITAWERMGRYEQAIQFVQEHPDLDAYSIDYEFLLKSGDIEAAIDKAWLSLSKYGSSSKDHAFRRFENDFKEFGYFDELVEGFVRRIYAAQPEDPELKSLLPMIAARCLEAARPRLALAVIAAPLKSTPLDRELSELNTEVLLQMGLTNAALAQFQKMPGTDNFHDEAETAARMAQLHYDLGETNKAKELINKVTAWSDSARMHLRLGDMYFGHKQFALAAPHYQRLVEKRDKAGFPAVLPRLAQCAAAVGNYTDARQYLRECARYPAVTSQLKDLKNWLGTVPAKTQAELLPTLRQLYPGDHRVCTLAAAYVHKKGDTKRALEILEQFLQAATPVKRLKHAGNLTGFIVAKKIDRALAGYLRSKPDSPLALLAVNRLNSVITRKDRPARKLYLDTLVESEHLDPELRLQLAASFADADDHDTAEKICRPLLTNNHPRFQRRAAEILHRINRPDGTADIIENWLTDYPGEFLQRPELIAILGRRIDREKLLRLFNVNVPYPNQADYYHLLLDYHTGQKETALKRLADVIDKPGLTSHQRLHLADLSASEGLIEQAIAGYKKTAGLDYYVSNRHAALIKLVELSPRDQNWQSTADALARIGTIRYEPATLAAVDQFFTLATERSLPPLLQAINKQNKERPNNENTAQLIGLYCQLSEKFGKSMSPADFSSSLKIGSHTRRSALRWTQFIEDWKVTPAPSIKVSLDLKKAPKPSDSAFWKPAPARETAGYIPINRFLGDSSTNANSAFARTTIKSKDNRHTTFTLGISQYARVWINGKLVLEATDNNTSAHPNSLRFHADLKAGDNEIMLHVGSLNGPPTFCIREILPSKVLELAQKPSKTERLEIQARLQSKSKPAPPVSGFE